MSQTDRQLRKVGCPEPARIELYILGDTAGDDTAELKAHIDTCDTCTDTFKELELLFELKTLFNSSKSPTAAAPLSIIDSIPGYSGLSEIQRGGQGVVFRAIQEDTRRTVAIKLLLNGAFATERQRSRFIREIELAASLRHPNIVTVHDSGVCDGYQYCVMEFVDGVRFDEFVQNHQPHERSRDRTRRILRLCQTVAAAVGHAHANGIIHRDLKPANILVDENEQPHILDFGLARLDDGEGATQSGEFLGTLKYASPEQASAQPDQMDIRTDVYSLGVLFYEALVGELPYDVDGSLDRVIVNIREADPIRPSRLVPGFNAELATIVLKALSKEKGRRYQSADELSRDIGRYLAGDPIDAQRDRPLYLAKKLISRYRYAVATAAFVFAVVCTALVVSVVLLRRASDDRDAARLAKNDADSARILERQRRVEVEVQRGVAEFNAYAASVAACDAALRVNDIAEAAIHLNRAPVSQRGFEWRYIQRRVDASRATLLGHSSYVEQILALQTRPWVISIGWDKQLIVWDRMTGQQVSNRTLPEWGWSVAVNNNEDLLAVGAWDGIVRLWSLPDLAPVASIEGREKRVMALAFDPNANRVAAAFAATDINVDRSELIVAHANTGQVVYRTELRGKPNRLQFTPTDNRLLCGDASGTVVLNAESGDTTETFAERLLAVGPNGSVALLSDLSVVVVRHPNGDPICKLQGHSDEIYAAAFSRDGKLIATGSDDQTVRVWDANTGAALKKLTGHQWRVTSVDFVPDSDLVISASWDQTIKVWDLTAEPERIVLPAHTDAVTCMTVNEEAGLMATGARDGSVRIWQIDGMNTIHEFHDHEKPVQDVAFNDNGTRIASASWDATIRVRDLENDDPPLVLRGHTGMVLAARFVPGTSTLLTGSPDNTIRVWNTDAGKLMRVIEGHDDHIHTIRFRPDNQQFASSGHRSIRLWDAQTFSPQAVIRREIVREDYSLEYSPDGRQLAAGTERSIGFWQPDDGSFIDSVLANRDEMRSIDYSPNGSRLVSVAVDGTVRIWDVKHRTPLITLRDAPAAVRRAVFRPDGDAVIGGLDDGRLVLWKGRSG